MPSHPIHQDIRVAVDAAIFTIKDEQLKMLGIQMKKAPFTDRWALPGGLIEDHETTEQAARRILKTQTGVSDVYLEQLRTFDDPNRDPAGHVISIAYYALIPDDSIALKTTDKYKAVDWMSTTRLPPLAYDHRMIARSAIDRLKAKLQYTNIAWSLLPKVFTLTELQRVYEIILGHKLDKRNFRKRILSLNLIKKTGKQKRDGAHRPAALYQFKDRKLKYVEMM